MILEMSDSLKDTVIVIACVLTISMSPELLDDDELLEPLRLPAVEAELPFEPELELPFEVELELALEPEPPAETVSPGETSETLTTVPVAGA